jgi:GAF domain-containing protein
MSSPKANRDVESMGPFPFFAGRLSRAIILAIEGPMTQNEAIRSLQTEVTRLRQENQDLRDELTLLRASVRAVRVLQELIDTLSPDVDVLAWIDELLSSALAAVGAQDGSLILLDEEKNELVFAVVHGEARGQLSGYRMPLGEGIAGWVAENRMPEILQDPRGDPRFSPMVDEMLGFRTRSIACVPLVAGDRVLGVIEAINKGSDRDFTVQDQDLMMVVAQLAAMGISRAESFVEES